MPQGVHALPHAVALGRRPGGAAKPRLGRGRQRAADARGVRRGARRDQEAGRRTRSAFPNQHYNSLTSWGVDSNGEVKHVYA